MKLAARVAAVLAGAGAALASTTCTILPYRGSSPRRRSRSGARKGDIVCFLEDDVVLEPDYLRNIEAGFIERPAMVGSCGIVTNLPPLPPFYSRLFHFFHRGIFHDPRVGVTGVMNGSGHGAHSERLHQRRPVGIPA